MAPSPDHTAILLPVGLAVAITVCTVGIHAIATLPLIHVVRYEFRLGRAGVWYWRDVAIVAGVTLVSLAAHLVAIATWGLVFSLCGNFSRLAEAVYHSGLNYTTLGDTEAILPPAWRFLLPLEGANGMLMFGVSTASLFAVIQRLIQTRFGKSGSSQNRKSDDKSKA
jgi:hypothetical protein